MDENILKFQEKLKELIPYAKRKKGVLEFQEINDFFGDIQLNEEQIEKIYEYLEENNIDVLRITSDDDDDLPDDDVIAKQRCDEVHHHGRNIFVDAEEQTHDRRDADPQHARETCAQQAHDDVDDRRELDIIAHDAGGEGADVHLTLDAEVVDAGLERDDRGKAVQNAGRCPADGVAELRTSAEGTLDDQLCGVDRVFPLRADQQRADEKHADEGHDVTHDADLPLKGKDLSTLKRVEIHITCYHFRALLTSAGRFPCRFSLYTYHRRKARRCR